jgi:hypothetical protein
MAMKNPEFTERLKKAIAGTGLNNPAFAEKAKINYRSLMGYLMPGTVGHVPEWDQLVKISDASGRSIDWLLTGKDPADFTCDWPEPIRNACKTVRKILESDDAETAVALSNNITAFAKSLKNHEENKALRNDVEALKQEILTLKKLNGLGLSTGTDQAASLSTGK